LRWERQVDFSALQTLQLWYVGLKTLEKASECQFSPLKALVLELNFDDFDTTRETLGQRMDAARSALLLHLAPLQSLHLGRIFAQLSFQAVLEHHGSSLRTLALFPAISYTYYEPFRMTPERINMIRTRCANMSDLRLSTPRSKGDRQEVEAYRALGAIP
jgi:hypothetical protein